MALKRSLLIGLAALLLVAPAAEARSPFHLIASGSSVTTDGERYALLSDRNGVPYRVIDDQTGRSWPLPSAPAGCEAYSVQVANGQLLWELCPILASGAVSSRPVLQDLETGGVRPVPGWDAYLSWFATRAGGGWTGSGPTPDRFGSPWLRARIGCYHCGAEWSYINWQTGRLVPYLNEVATTVPDVDAPELQVPLCAPLRRRIIDGQSYEPDYFADSVYERPWYLRSGLGRYVQLYRCGHRKAVRIHRCSALSDCSPQLGAGYLTWSDPSWRGVVPVIKAFRLADRRRVGIGKLKGAASVQHTSSTVYVNTANGKVYAARLPRR
jgi:hypothetical protein